MTAQRLNSLTALGGFPSQETKFKEKFYGRKKELQEIHEFLKADDTQVFGVYGVPMIGKTLLVKKALETLPRKAKAEQIHTIRFQSPENPDSTFRKFIEEVGEQKWNLKEPFWLIIENFEEALDWKYDENHLHEIKFEYIQNVLESLIDFPKVKIILESRFEPQLRFVSPLAYRFIKNLGEIDRLTLFKAMNADYRNNAIQEADFLKLCEGLNDHIWLIQQVMSNPFQFMEEALEDPEQVLKELWKKVNFIFSRLSFAEKLLLYAFSLRNPLVSKQIYKHLTKAEAFRNKNRLRNALMSLRKKLFFNYQPPTYEMNPFIREACFTFMETHPQAQQIDNIPYFQVDKPQYDPIKQAQQRGDYGTFYRLIKQMRRDRKYQEVHEILKNALDYDQIINKAGVLNEIRVTYKWQRKYKEAKKYLQKAMDLGNLHSFNEFAIILYQHEKNYKEAKNTLNQALKIKPNDVKILNELAIIYKLENNYTEAKNTLNQALNIEPKNIRILNELAIIYKLENDYTEAKKILKRACDLGNIQSFNELAIIYKLEKNYTEAKKILKRACDLGNIQSFNELAIIYKLEKNYTEAKKILKRACNLGNIQ